MTDKLAADLAVQASTQGQGYGYNHANGKDIYRNDSDVVARSKWVFDATPNTHLTTIFDYSQNRNSFVGIERSSRAPKYHPSWVRPTATPILGTPTPTPSPCYSPRGAVGEHQAGTRLRVSCASPTSSPTASPASSTPSIWTGTATPFERTYLFDREHAFSEEAQISVREAEPHPVHRRRLTISATTAKYVPGSQLQFPGPAYDPAAPLDAIGIIGQQITTSAAGYFQANTEILPATNLTFGGALHLRGAPAEGVGDRHHSRQHPDRDPGYGGYVQELLSADVPMSPLDHRFSDEVLAYASFNTGLQRAAASIPRA